MMTLDELQRCETVIEKGLQSFIEVGEALAEIRENKGYKLSCNTFEEYCKSRWNISANYARRTIKSTETVKRLAQNGYTCTENITEGQIRPITKLEPAEQINFVETHDISVMTAKEIQEAVMVEHEETPKACHVAPFSEHEETPIDEMTREQIVKMCYGLMKELEEEIKENKRLREENIGLKKGCVKNIFG